MLNIRSQKTDFSVLCSLFSVLCFLFSVLCYAEEKVPFHWEAGRSEAYLEEQVLKKVVLEKSVKIWKEDLLLLCEKAEYYPETSLIILSGNITFQRGEQKIEAKEGRFNIKKETGEFYPADFFSPPWFGKGERIEVQSREELIIRQGYFTTCDIEPPHYRFASNKITLLLNKKITARPVIMYVGNVPVFAAPIYAQDLKAVRPSLTFVPGYDSKWGTFLLTGFHNRYKDKLGIDTHIDYRKRKGIGLGIDIEPFFLKEYGGKGEIKTYYLNEEDTGDNRYRLGWKYRQSKEKEGTEYLVLSEFHKFSDSLFNQDYFYSDYLSDVLPESFLSFSQRRENRYLGFLVLAEPNDFFDRTEKIPELTASFPTQKIGNLYLSGETTLSSLSREIDGERRGTLRLDTKEVLSCNKKVNFINLRPFVGFQFTAYTKDKEKEESARPLFLAGIQTNSKFFKDYEIKGKNLRHYFQPSLSFNWQETSFDASRLYSFDEIDSLESDRYLTFEIINRLVEKKEKKREVLRSDILYHHSLKDSSLSVMNIWTDFFPTENISFISEINFAPQKSDWETGTTSFVYKMKKADFSLSHSFQKSLNNDLTSSLYYPLNEKWQFRLSGTYNFKRSGLGGRELTLYRDLHCWASSFTFYQDRDEKAFYLVLHIKAFPKYPIKVRTKFRKPVD